MIGLFRRFLSMLPRDVRVEYGREMEEVVREQWVQEQERVRPRPMRFWCRQLWAVMRAGITMRAEERRRARRIQGERRTDGGGGMDGLIHDLRQTLRGLWKRPGFAAITVLTLGLGIGASTAIFSAVHAVLFRELPYDDPEEVVVVFHENTVSGERGFGLSPSNARDIHETSELLSHVAVAEPWSLDLEVDGRAQALRAWAVSDGFFEAVGVEPIQGRSFTEAEYAGTENPVVLVGHRSWQNRFGGDPELVGKTLAFQQGGVTVAGILGPDFKLPDEAELWVPRAPQPYDANQRSADYMLGVARLRPGATVQQAQTELTRIGASLAEAYPEDMGNTSFRAVPLREHLFGDVRTPLMVLLAAVGLVLLIACGNVAGLMLARGARRQREYALRGALGASTTRLVRQITVESLILAAFGCLLGIGITYLGVGVIGRLGPDHLPRIDEVAIDGSVLLFAVAVSAISAVLSGITPSIKLSRPELASALGDGSRGSTRGPGSLRVRNRLVVVEVAAAVVLLVGAGLLTRSFTTLLDEELGFDPDGRLAVQVFAYDGYETPEARAAFVREAIENLEALPGVSGVALTSSVPSATDGQLASIDIDLRFTIGDRAAPPPGQEPIAAISQVSPGFFEVMEMPIVEGRAFDDADDADGVQVVVVNEALARRHFGDQSPIGETLVIGFRPLPREVVGVVADIRPQGYESEPRPEVYFPLNQFGTGSLTFVVASEVDAGTLVAPSMEAIWNANPAQSIWGTATLDSLLDDWLTERTFNLLLMASLAVIALALAGIGIYGLISFSVEERVAEMGIRRALGGGAASILKMVLVEGTRLAALGLALGLILAYPLTRFIQGMLHGVEAADPVVLLGLVLAVMVVAGLAAFVPAMRAVRADPMTALRTE